MYLSYVVSFKRAIICILTKPSSVIPGVRCHSSSLEFHFCCKLLVEMTPRETDRVIYGRRNEYTVLKGCSTWTSYQIRKIAGCACAGNAGNVFPAPTSNETASLWSWHTSRHVRHVFDINMKHFILTRAGSKISYAKWWPFCQGLSLLMTRPNCLSVILKVNSRKLYLMINNHHSLISS